MTDNDRVHQIAQHLAQVIQLMGLKTETDPELGGTPLRVARGWLELFRGARQPPPDISVMENPQSSEEMVLVRDLPFYSMCVHHLVPFFGRCDIAYVPGDKIAGLSGLGRILQHYASQPQLQERLTAAVADRLQVVLRPRGVIVWLQARQLCLEMRLSACQAQVGGIGSPALVETTASRGVFQTGRLRDEFFARVKGAEPPRSVSDGRTNPKTDH